MVIRQVDPILQHRLARHGRVGAGGGPGLRLHGFDGLARRRVDVGKYADFRPIDGNGAKSHSGRLRLRRRSRPGIVRSYLVRRGQAQCLGVKHSARRGDAGFADALDSNASSKRFSLRRHVCFWSIVDKQPGMAGPYSRCGTVGDIV